MANNEISGPSVLTHLLKEIILKKKKYFSVRAVFVPETIGSIAYINKNLNSMKKIFFQDSILHALETKGVILIFHQEEKILYQIKLLYIH